MKRRALYAVLLLSGLFLFSQGNKIGYASEFPSRSVELILSGSAGGPADIGLRIIGPELAKALGVPVIFTNKGGAGGALSAEYVARAKPNGYTILGATGNIFNIILVMNPDLAYKLSDLIPLCKYAAMSPTLYAVTKASPFKRFEDLVSYAKKNPGKLTCATPGTGTASHFALEMLKLEAGIDIAHMPAKSGGEVVTALLGGQVDFVVITGGPIIGLMRSGDARCLVSISSQRIPEFPDVPTLGELGYHKSTLLSWIGFFLPKGTPKPVMDKLAMGFERAIKSPAVKKNLENAGYAVDYQDGPSLAKVIPEEYKIIEEIAKKAKLIK